MIIAVCLLSAALVTLIIVWACAASSNGQPAKFEIKTKADAAILRKLGQGGMGTVSVMMHSKTGQLCACKTTGGSARNKPYLLKEIEMLKTLNHKHIVSYLGSFNESGEVQLFLEYAAHSVEKLLQDCRRAFHGVMPSACRTYAKQILLGLHYLHTNKIVHADLKPGNILLTPEGVIKISDFGTAKKMTGDALPKSGISSGLYTAPEVRAHKPHGTAADIWSFGMTLREMVTGQRPSTARLNGCPNNLKDIIEQCLESDPKKRPTTADLLKHEYFGSSTLASEKK